ncbi:plasminogen activator, urokinase receptor [Rhinolophus ferrumequinum]|uniref:Urokinase plasminogen activator surface receptor n=2 Tax=Rhinolophus ferrumequinum TaxID=59479 RepID=A0A671FXV4_RHIFE|nr:urokinase plasminogen activator surface receptor [Rhinolophus ferrumequinum]KAF6288781.1 plasminogen activator, urokinase receptor [Rhinolophus ferrumequinum]
MGFSLLLQLLLVQTCIRASWGLQCVLCDITGSCQVKECAPDQNLCRTTAIHTWQESEDLELVERGCAHPEKTNRTMSYRTGVKIITLTEAVCESDLCNRPKPGRVVTFPRSRYLECVSCASSDLSCERGLDRSLQCRSPGEECLDMVTHHSLEGNPGDERHSRGCGNLPGCPGPTGFHNNHTFHFLRCCNTTKCNTGPVLELRNLPLNGLQCYSCEGNRTHGCSSEETSLTDCRGPMSRCLEATGTHELGNQSYIVRGCATPSWCQGLHVAEAFRLTHFDVSCCIGNRCNDPMLDIQPRRGGAPRPGPDHLSFTIGTLLVTARLWGGTLLCT